MTKITLDVHQFPCLNDNYGYLVHEAYSGETAAIDTPDADKYLAEAKRMGWTITHILNTHWHPDHAGGNMKIKDETGCTIYGPAGEAEKIPGIDVKLKEGDDGRAWPRNRPRAGRAGPYAGSHRLSLCRAADGLCRRRPLCAWLRPRI
jgi:glyoxylase-like metal-dependent hydrolase (beta-lactamase superfamily II)